MRAMLQVALATGGVHTAADVLPALRVAACNDHAAVVLALLGTGAAGVDDKTDACPPPLRAASFYGSSAGAAVVLVQAKVGADNAATPRSRPDFGSPPALMAAWTGHTDSMQVLMQAKADFDKATTNNGSPPALAVAWKGRAVLMQAVVRVFCKVEPELHELVLHI